MSAADPICNKQLIKQWFQAPHDKSKSASVTIGNVPWSSQKIELTVHSNTSSTFLQTWDQMKTTSFCILSLTGRANKWHITFKISEMQESVEEAVCWFMPHDINPALTHLMNWLHKYSTDMHKRLQKTLTWQRDITINKQFALTKLVKLVDPDWMFFSISYLAAIDGQMKCQTCHPKAVKLARLAELRIELQCHPNLCWFECYCNSKVVALILQQGLRGQFEWTRRVAMPMPT